MNCIRVPQIMMPKEGTDLYKWSVVACDQFTSQPEYWKDVEDIVEDAPSTLKLILPEVYLGDDNEQARVDSIHKAMRDYVSSGILEPVDKGFVLVERNVGRDNCRNGLVVAVDLETYEYKKGAGSLIRPTEMTVEERIPPRLKVRQTATLELPHIMLLIDDPDCSIIEPLIARKNDFVKLYDTDLMKDGGHISGFLVPEGDETERLMKQFEALADPEAFKEKYNLDKDYPLLNFAVGDGNHSMATAKAAWENIKKDLSDEEKETHPARFCLCEIVNIHDKSLEIEPIHRVLFNVDEEELMAAAKKYYEEKGCEFNCGQIVGFGEAFENEEKSQAGNSEDADADDKTLETHCFELYCQAGKRSISVGDPCWGIPVATLQSFLDGYLALHEGAKIDYIHGDDVVKELSSKKGNVGFILPEVKKEDLFIGVIKDGVLPRKTFSMGEAYEKRYYMECKNVR